MKEDRTKREDELEMRRIARDRRQRQQKKQKRSRRLRGMFLILLLSVMAAAVIWALSFFVNRRMIRLSEIEAPDWIEQDFFQKNPYSRPGTKMSVVDGIVIHYVANPKTSARQNWNYFNGLANQTEEKKISASSHFLIGLEGEILQGIPIDEMAYATSKEKNKNTISIECCHPDETGQFTEATYASLVKLTAWLCDSLNLKESDVIRHYDATGKDCPRYYVAHEDAWKAFRKAVKKERKASS